MLVPDLEKSLGIEVYATRSPGIGGVIRHHVEDFMVEEILVDGSKANLSDLQNNTKRAVLGSSSTSNRYLLCVLVKRNWDTFTAIRNIAQQLNIHPARIQIGGIKDAKAVTAQHVTIEDISPEHIQNLRLKDIEVRPVGYLRNKLSPYYLLGNSFHIRIRGIKHSEATVRKRVMKTVENLKKLGIPNFFGHQRFGTTRPITHLVGKAIVRGNLKNAAMLFLAKPSLYEHPSSRQVRQELRAKQDYELALKTFPKQLRYERLMLRSLTIKKGNFPAAFRKLPIKLRELFIQAYQSYLFNRFLSCRLKKGYSLSFANPGDYVINVERSGLPMPRMHRTANPENLEEINHAIKNGGMRLAIPLIGFKQPSSQGVQGKIEQEILQQEGISPHDFGVAAMPEISSKGELRAMITPVQDFSLSYASDDIISQRTGTARVDFSLYRGSYATIVLREIMKPRNPIEAGF